jgi:hypothetical protein
MPKAISITETEKKWIKELLEIKFKFKILDRYTCNICADKIYKVTGYKISTSTLNRLFDFVPNNSTSSSYTLQVLAETMGFTCYNDFLNYISVYNYDSINQLVQLYNTDEVTFRMKLVHSLRKVNYKTWEDFYRLQNIISLAIQKNDTVLLNAILNLEDYINESEYDKVIIVFQNFYFEAKRNNDFIISFVENNVNHSLLLQKCLVESYVDENYLNTFFGKWIYALRKNKRIDLRIFIYLIECQNKFNLKEEKSAKVLLSKAINLINSESYDIHPILKARLFFWSILLRKENNIDLFLDTLKSPSELTDFYVFVSRLIWQYSDELKPIIYIEKHREISPLLVCNFYEKGRYNIFLLIKSINSYLKNNIEESISFYKLVDKNLFAFDIVNYNFFKKWILKLDKEYRRRNLKV